MDDSTVDHVPRGPKRFLLDDSDSSSSSFKNSVISDSPTRFPIIISTSDSNLSFKKLSFSDLTSFIKLLEQSVGSVKSTSLASRGDLFVRPIDEKQKTVLLAIIKTSFGNVVINVTKTKSETEIKGIVHNIPSNEPHEAISALHPESQTASWIVKFASHRPHSIVLPYRSFPVIEFKRKPTHCANCWGFSLAILPHGAPIPPVAGNAPKTTTPRPTANLPPNALTAPTPPTWLVVPSAQLVSLDKKFSTPPSNVTSPSK